jgi:myo-inositol-1-phosphate synthase
MGKVRIAIAGVGNCASSLLQGIDYYRNVPREQHEAWGLMHLEMGGYRPGDVEVVAAFDVDARKVGRPLHEAAFAPPNCTTVISDHIAKSEVVVQMGPVHDGVAPHMADYPPERSFRVADERPVDVAKLLRRAAPRSSCRTCRSDRRRRAGVRGSVSPQTGVSLVNCVPVFIVSDPMWGERFRQAGIPCAGDDIKSQVGATILHRAVVRLLADRGVEVERTYQLNTGGNTDFLNMLSRHRLVSKKISKTEAVTSQIPYEIGADNVHIGLRLCALAVRQQGLLPARRRARLRRRHRAGSAALGAGFAELGGHRDRRVALREGRARARRRVAAAADLCLHDEASAGADARRRRRAPDRSVPGDEHGR